MRHLTRPTSPQRGWNTRSSDTTTDHRTRTTTHIPAIRTRWPLEKKVGGVPLWRGSEATAPSTENVVAFDSTTVHDLHLDVSGCGSRQAVLDRLANLVQGLQGMVRLTIHGDLDPDVDLQDADLRDALATSFDAAQIRYRGPCGSLRLAYDIDAIKLERTVRGRFVIDVLGSNLPEDEQRRVLTAGLRALDGRADLDVL